MGIKRCKRVYPDFKYFFLSRNTDYRGAKLDHQHRHSSGGEARQHLKLLQDPSKIHSTQKTAS